MFVELVKATYDATKRIATGSLYGGYYCAKAAARALKETAEVVRENLSKPN